MTLRNQTSPQIINVLLFIIDSWQLGTLKKLNTINKLTFALVNCTIGPSSDTTWFPTWMKGILPADGNKTHCSQSNDTKPVKSTGAAASILTWRWHEFCICSVNHLHRQTAHPEIGLHKRETRPGLSRKIHQIIKKTISCWYCRSSIKKHTHLLKFYLDRKRRGTVWQQNLIF